MLIAATLAALLLGAPEVEAKRASPAAAPAPRVAQRVPSPPLEVSDSSVASRRPGLEHRGAPRTSPVDSRTARTVLAVVAVAAVLSAGWSPFR